MKFVSLCLLLVTASFSAGAQRFYYFENAGPVDQALKTKLEKADQYVVPSVLGSEYTVRTRIRAGDDERELNLEIVLADSVTQKEVYRASEQICFTNGKAEPEMLYYFALRAFVNRRVGEMIRSAKNDHNGIFEEGLRARKDKT